MEQTNYPIPNSRDLLEKILSRECKLHPSFPCEYIHVTPSEFSPRLCCKCNEERNIPSNEYISIRLLLQASSNATFNAYPKLNDSSITQKMQKFQGTSDQVSEELLSFFDNLKSTVSKTIEKKKSDQKIKLASLSTCYHGIYDSLAQIQQIEIFQELVKNENDNEEPLKRFIKDQYSQANNYTHILNNKLLEYQKIYEGFSLTDNKNKLDQIINLIERIEFFPTIPQSQVNNSQQQQQQQQQSTSSLVVYNEYLSLIEQGINRKIVQKSQKWSWSLQSWSQLYEYATTYEKWQKFSGKERKQQLRILKRELDISI